MRNFKKEMRIHWKKNCQDTKSWTEVVEKMPKKWGLVKKSHTGMSEVFYVTKKHGFIVKRPYSGDPLKTPRCAIFTMRVPFFLNSDEHIDECLANPLYLQPLADTTKKREALSAIEESKYGDEIDDLHINNVAVYQKKAVAIDW